MAENPYEPPVATVADPVLNNAGPRTLVHPKKLPAGRGWTWIKEAFKFFMQSPVIWIVNLIILFVMMMLLAFIPLIGTLASNILTPIFTGGLMQGLAAQDRGDPLTVNHLFEGFQKNAGNLALVGLLYMAGMIIIFILIAIIVFLFGSGSDLFSTLVGMESSTPPSPEQIQILMSVGGIAILAGIGLAVPLIMAYYFAPALIVHHNLGAIEAMKLSFKGCMKNIIPFLVFGLISFVLVIAASIPFFLGWLVLAPVLFAAMYVSYKEIFTD